MANLDLGGGVSSLLSGAQYLRKIKLIVYDTDLNGLDLSQLRIKFSVKRSDVMTPNVADIRVYNLSKETALSIFLNLNPTPNKPNRGRVVLQAGYEQNFGVIFQGNIKQIILGNESATDTFVDIIAGDGDRAYNFAIVNTTLSKGSTQTDQVKAAATATAKKGVTLGHLGDLPGNQLPRGKVMYGNARNYLRDVAQNTNRSWSVQDEKITYVSNTSYLPGERVVLTSKTGLIGTPQQTTDGLNAKCLLNPLLKIGSRIEIADAIVADFKINLSIPNSPANIAVPFSADGTYYVLVVEHTGDTRGIEWYSNLICLNTDVTAPPLTSV